MIVQYGRPELAVPIKATLRLVGVGSIAVQTVIWKFGRFGRRDKAIRVEQAGINPNWIRPTACRRRECRGWRGTGCGCTIWRRRADRAFVLPPGRRAIRGSRSPIPSGGEFACQRATLGCPSSTPIDSICECTRMFGDKFSRLFAEMSRFRKA